MNIQQEAAAHISKNREEFLKELQTYMNPLEKFITSSLHNTTEVANALEHLTEVELWSRKAAELWGLR
jgi:hypothetical protein|tara:strand:- start:526 stop:729 length:204 start_codon:yes stop_codon:yes gene_type:complete